MNNSYNNVNIEKLNSTLATMKNINSSLENTDISKYFIDIENTLKKINFEHGNCISNYRDEINAIIEKLNILKENIASLENSLTVTSEEFSTVEHREVANNSASVTQIPPVTQQTENQVQGQTQTSNEINTVPIGLGIATAGIVGSVGAVVVDSMKDRGRTTKSNEPEIEEYEPTDKGNNTIASQATGQSEQPGFYDATPYHAARNNETKNKFYGTGITEYYEKEDNDDSK